MESVEYLRANIITKILFFSPSADVVRFQKESFSILNVLKKKNDKYENFTHVEISKFIRFLK